jgi:hypothetical protein
MIKKPACAGSVPQCLFALREVEQAYRLIQHGVAGYTYQSILHKLGRSGKVPVLAGCRSGGRLLCTSTVVPCSKVYPVSDGVY